MQVFAHVYTSLARLLSPRLHTPNPHPTSSSKSPTPPHSLALELEAGVGAEAEGTKSSEIPAWDTKIRILDPNGGFTSTMLVFQKDFDEKWPLSKLENWTFPRGDRAIQSPLSLQVYHQKCILREPYSRNLRGDPPFSSISFLLTARA